MLAGWMAVYPSRMSRSIRTYRLAMTPMANSPTRIEATTKSERERWLHKSAMTLCQRGRFIQASLRIARRPGFSRWRAAAAPFLAQQSSNVQNQPHQVKEPPDALIPRLAGGRLVSPPGDDRVS